MKYYHPVLTTPGPPPKGIHIPEYVKVCEICGGTGKHPKHLCEVCWCCKREPGDYQGVGYVYIATLTPVPDSILNYIWTQIEYLDEVKAQLEGKIPFKEPTPSLADLLSEWE